MDINVTDLPFQVQQLVRDLLNKGENIHIRQNYRSRLVSIKETIDKAVRKFDDELYLSNTTNRRQKRV